MKLSKSHETLSYLFSLNYMSCYLVCVDMSFDENETATENGLSFQVDNS